MLPRRVPPRGGRLAVVAGVGLVIWVMRVPVTLDGVRPCRVVVASREVAEVMVRDLLTGLLSLLLRLRGEGGLGLLVVVLGDGSSVKVMVVMVLVVGVVWVLGMETQGSGREGRRGGARVRGRVGIGRVVKGHAGAVVKVVAGVGEHSRGGAGGIHGCED